MPDKQEMLSPHVSVREFSCSHCGKLPPGMYDDGALTSCYDYLFDSFEHIRDEWGKPITITSGYRCPKHNTEVGGEPLSVHLFGLALDLGITGDDVAPFITMVRETGRDLRIGWKQYGGKLVHIDCAHFVWPRPSEFYKVGIEW